LTIPPLEEFVEEVIEDTSRKMNDADEFKQNGEEIFIPSARLAIQENHPFVLDLASRKLIHAHRKVESGQIYEQLTKLGKGDIAWDDKLLTTQKAQLFSIPQEDRRPLKYIAGEYNCNSYKLPDKVEMPYTLLACDKECGYYLITIRKIESDGIRIFYRNVDVEELKKYHPTKKKSE